MSRAVVILGLQSERKRAADWCMKAPAGTIVEFKESKRTIPQNSRFHAMCTDVARQIEWRDIFGRPIKMGMEQWKRFFLAAWTASNGAAALVVPNEDGTAFYDLGVQSSKLTKAQMGEVMELIAAFGAERGVVFQEEEMA